MNAFKPFNHFVPFKRFAAFKPSENESGSSSCFLPAGPQSFLKTV